MQVHRPGLSSAQICTEVRDRGPSSHGHLWTKAPLGFAAGDRPLLGRRSEPRPRATTLRRMLRSRPSSARDLALIASFSALVAVLGLPGSLTLFGNAVPITLQTLGVMLAGGVRGGPPAGAALLVSLVLVPAGLPLLPGGRGGLGLFAGPSAV